MQSVQASHNTLAYCRSLMLVFKLIQREATLIWLLLWFDYDMSPQIARAHVFEHLVPQLLLLFLKVVEPLGRDGSLMVDLILESLALLAV